MAVLLTTAGRPMLTAGGRPILTVPRPVPGATAITGAELPFDQVYPAVGLGAGGQAQVSVTANYAGVAGAMQAAVVPFGGGTARASWQALSASGGQAAGTIAVARGGPYGLVVRDASSGVVWQAAGRFFVGDTGALYGQSNMLHFLQDSATFQASQARARRQSGGGWNVVCNAEGETFPTVPPTVFGGVTNPGLGVAGEIQVTSGDGAASFVVPFQMASGAPFGLHPYALAGQNAAQFDPTSGPLWAKMMGAAGQTGAFNETPYAFSPSFAIRYQGEDNAGASGVASTMTAAWVAERNGWWSKTGRTASTFRLGLVSLGPTNGYGTVGAFGIERAAALAFVADPANGAFYAANTSDATLDSVGSQAVHLDSPSLVRLGRRMAVTTARALGFAVSGSAGAFTTGAGPRVTGITRSGAVMTLVVGDMDGSTALVTADGGAGSAGLGGFRVFDSGGAVVAIQAAAIVGHAVQLTLPSGVSYPVTVDHQMADAPYGLPPVASQVVTGNNVVPGDTRGAPLWPFAAVSVA